VNHFIDLFNQKYRRSIQEISSRALALLVDYPWPGNVRELRNALEYAFVCSQGTVLERPALPVEVQSWSDTHALRTQEPSPPAPSPANGRGRSHAEKVPADPEGPASPGDRERMLSLLERFRGNRSRLAKELGIGRTTLWRKLKELGIEEVYR
jgi:DNA-binding NtrC family response regulator